VVKLSLRDPTLTQIPNETERLEGIFSMTTRMPFDKRLLSTMVPPKCSFIAHDD
jgi:hypothetical protein